MYLFVFTIGVDDNPICIVLYTYTCVYTQIYLSIYIYLQLFAHIHQGHNQ